MTNQATAMIQYEKLQYHIKFIQKQWLSNINFNKIAQSVLSLQRGLTGERTLITKHYMDDAEYLSAYLAYYWPVSYVQIQHCQQTVQDAGASLVEPGIQELSILDFGSGPAPMSTGLLDYIAAIYPDIHKVNLFFADISMAAMEIGEKIIKHSFYPFTVNCNKLSTNTFEKLSGYTDAFDVIIFGHSFNELAQTNTQNIVQVFEHTQSFITHTLKSSGAVLFIEPALLATSRRLISLRNFLIKNKTIAYTLPCPHAILCSVPEAGPSHTCHDEFIWKMPQSVSRLAQANALNREYIKMTWFFMFREFPHIKNKKNQSDFYLVVSEPLLNKAGRIRYILCGSNGRVALSAAKTDAHAKALGFFELKRGDKIILENPEQRETGFGIVQTTKITLLQ